LLGKIYIRILQNIPKMDDNALSRLFINAQRLLYKNPENQDTISVIEAIKTEWEKRLREFRVGKHKASSPEQGVLSVVGYKVGNEGEKPRSEDNCWITL
jgi:hypothetical protein